MVTPPKVTVLYDDYALTANQLQDWVSAQKGFAGPPTGANAARIDYVVNYLVGDFWTSGARFTLNVNGTDIVDDTVPLGATIEGHVDLDVDSLYAANALLIGHDNSYGNYSTFLFTITLTYSFPLPPGACQLTCLNLTTGKSVTVGKGQTAKLPVQVGENLKYSGAGFLPDTQVDLQHAIDGVWTTVKTYTTDSTGKFITEVIPVLTDVGEAQPTRATSGTIISGTIVLTNEEEFPMLYIIGGIVVALAVLTLLSSRGRGGE